MTIMCRLWYLRRSAVNVVVALLVSAATTFAQTPPDSLKRDTVRTRVPVPVTDSTRSRIPVTDSLRDSTGALLPAALQRVATAQDSARLARERYVRDSIRAFRAADTIKAPLAKFQSPPNYELSPRLRLDRNEILSSGSMYLTDIIERVPGVTGFRSGWLAGIHASSYRGDFRRVRIFVDGVEFDGNNGRENGIPDQAMIPLWTLETIEIERTASEVRVWCRTITPSRSTPYSRVDIFTGDLNTNAFRGVFMRRFGNGVAFQVGGQQASTQRGSVQSTTGATSGGTAGDGDQQAYSARLGWAKKKWSIDAFATAVTHKRDRMEALEDHTSLPAFEGGRRDAYARIYYGDSSSGPWLLAMLATTRSNLVSQSAATPTADTVHADTVLNGRQTVLGAGWRKGSLDLSIVDRVRAVNGASVHSPVARAVYNRERVTTGLYAERAVIDSTTRTELFARVRPTNWSALTVSQSMRRPYDSSSHTRENGTLAEASVRLAGRWLGAGVLRHGESVAASPIMLGAQPADLIVPASTAATFSIRGPIYRALAIDVQGMRFNQTALARPQMRVYTELRLATNWLSRFPRGQFSIDARIRHEWRDPVAFYYGVDTETTPIVRSTESTQLMHGVLEIRIQQATLFYQFRNLTGASYSQIPGIVMPPAVQVYGVRWEFWN